MLDSISLTLLSSSWILKIRLGLEKNKTFNVPAKSSWDIWQKWKLHFNNEIEMS